MFSHNKNQRVLLVVILFLLPLMVQTAAAWDMIPPDESVKNATEEFNEAWRLEAGQKFREQRNVGTNNIVSYILITSLVVMLVVAFHLMVKLNHLDRMIRSVRPDMLESCTKIWLISRWGLRY